MNIDKRVGVAAAGGSTWHIRQANRRRRQGKEICAADWRQVNDMALWLWETRGGGEGGGGVRRADSACV